jgi:hypothetical protein
MIINKNNQVAIKMINNNQITKRSKHININCYFIHKRFKNQDIKIRYYYINKMVANNYIKSLIIIKFNIFIKLLNLCVFKEEFTY